MNYIIEYVNKINSGEIVTSKRVAKVYNELKDRIEHPTGRYIFDEESALRPIKFIESFCRHSKGDKARQLIELELFQKAYIQALFGFVDANIGFRQYRESLLLVARKCGKSTLLSAIALYMLLADNETGAEIYSIATKREQAYIVFESTLNMIKQDQYLSTVLKKRKTDVYCDFNMSKIQPLSSDSNTLDGLNSHLVIIDELHAIKSRGTYEVMKQSLSSREQPMLIMISTAGTVRESIFDDTYEYATKVADGIYQDETFLPIIYELDDPEEYLDPDNWMKANPALGTIKKHSYIEQQLDRAKNNPVDLRGILVKDFNVRGSETGTWLDFSQINNEKTFDLSSFQNYYAIGGMDLSSNVDLTCATVLIFNPDDNTKYVHQHYWIPEDSKKIRTAEERSLLEKWEERGLLTFTQGNLINYSLLTRWFLDIVNVYNINLPYIYYDRYSASHLVLELEREGFNMIPTAQGVKTLSLPMQTLGADLAGKRVNYNNNPILKWCLTNTAVKEDINGNIQPKKTSNPSRRIDGTASLLDAYVGLLERYEEIKNLQPSNVQ